MKKLVVFLLSLLVFFGVLNIIQDNCLRALQKLPTGSFFEDIIQKTVGSVVHITNEDGGWQGSGVLITPDLILSARHVVENSDSFVVTFNDDNSVSVEQAISSKKYDLGFIKLKEPVDIIPAKLGSIKECRLGQQIYCIGSPYGKINFNSVTLGIISGLDRDWEEIDPYTGEPYGWEVSFTSDAAAHPGNSGCGVFTMDGILRGILVGGYSPVLNCSMPVDLVMEDIDEICLMFTQNEYEFEEESIYDPYEDYYSLPGPGLGE